MLCQSRPHVAFVSIDLNSGLLTTGHFGVRVLPQVSVKDGITDLVTNLVCGSSSKTFRWCDMNLESLSGSFEIPDVFEDVFIGQKKKEKDIGAILQFCLY